MASYSVLFLIAVVFGAASVYAQDDSLDVDVNLGRVMTSIELDLDLDSLMNALDSMVSTMEQMSKRHPLASSSSGLPHRPTNPRLQTLLAGRSVAAVAKPAKPASDPCCHDHQAKHN